MDRASFLSKEGRGGGRDRLARITGALQCHAHAPAGCSETPRNIPHTRSLPFHFQRPPDIYLSRRAAAIRSEQTERIHVHNHSAFGDLFLRAEVQTRRQHPRELRTLGRLQQKLEAVVALQPG